MEKKVNFLQTLTKGRSQQNTVSVPHMISFSAKNARNVSCDFRFVSSSGRPWPFTNAQEHKHAEQSNRHLHAAKHETHSLTVLLLSSAQ